MTSDVLSVKTTISKVEKLLNCSYYDYKYKKKDIIISRIKQQSSYHIASKLTKYLDLITPTIRFPALSMHYGPKKVKKSLSNLKATAVTPTILKELYQTTGIVSKAVNNSVAVCSYQGEYYEMSDLQAQWKKYNIDPTNVTNVPSDQKSGYGLECELDTQYMSSMGVKIPMQPWYTAGEGTLVGFENSLIQWSTNVLNSTNPALLYSTSYGQYEKNFGSAFVKKFSQDLMALGTAGITVLYSSGDYGAGGDCTSAQPFVTFFILIIYHILFYYNIFMIVFYTFTQDPHFPASSPYVTAVGGLEGGTPNQQPLGEQAWKQGGGGFSQFLGAQSYQTDAVQYYLTQNTNNLPASNKYNSSNRAYPDISAQAVDYLITIEGRSEGVSGTSCSTPSVGGIFGLLNDLRLQNNMSPLGFLNPFIYQTGNKDSTAFNDVTLGYINGCQGKKGFVAASKWDPASG